MRSLLNKASAIDFDNSTALPVVKASSNMMRQNGAWRSKGAWHGDSEKTTVVLSGVPKTLGTYGHGEVGEYGNTSMSTSTARQCQRYFSGFSLHGLEGISVSGSAGLNGPRSRDGKHPKTETEGLDELQDP